MKQRIDVYCSWAMYGICAACRRGPYDGCLRSLDGVNDLPQRRMIRRVIATAEET